MEKELDRIDRKILTELQCYASLPIAVLAGRVGLSQTRCWKRVQKLEASGVIIGRVAVVDARKVGLGLTVLCEVEAMDHTVAWRDKFLKAVEGFPEVIDLKGVRSRFVMEAVHRKRSLPL